MPSSDGYKNLKPIKSSERARELGKKGGDKSGLNKHYKALIRKEWLEIATQFVNVGSPNDSLKKKKYTAAAALMGRLFNIANGAYGANPIAMIKAITTIYELLDLKEQSKGETPAMAQQIIVSLEQKKEYSDKIDNFISDSFLKPCNDE
jgi:hypothetical protein